MFREGDIVHISNLAPEALKEISSFLGCNPEELTFVFNHYEGDKAVLTVEADHVFMIIRCSKNAIRSIEEEDQFQAELFLDHMIREVALDRALETKDKALFDAVMEYRANTPVPTRPEQKIDVLEKEEYDDDNLTFEEVAEISDQIDTHAKWANALMEEYGYPGHYDPFYDPYEDFGAPEIVGIDELADMIKDILDGELSNIKTQVKKEIKEEMQDGED